MWCFGESQSSIGKLRNVCFGGGELWWWSVFKVVNIEGGLLSKWSLISINQQKVSQLTLKVLNFWKFTSYSSLKPQVESLLFAAVLLLLQPTQIEEVDWVLQSVGLKTLWSGMGEVVPARTSLTLHPPSPPNVHQLSQLAL